MSRVTYPAFGSARDAADIDAAYTQITAQSGAVDRENMRASGIDKRNVKYQAVFGEDYGVGDDGATLTTISAGALALLQMDSGTFMELDLTGLTLGAHDSLVVFGSIGLVYDGTTPAVGAGDSLKAILYLDEGAGYAAIDGSGALANSDYGSLGLSAVVTGAGAYEKVGIFVGGNAGDVTIDVANLFAYVLRGSI